MKYANCNENVQATVSLQLCLCVSLFRLRTLMPASLSWLPKESTSRVFLQRVRLLHFHWSMRVRPKPSRGQATYVRQKIVSCITISSSVYSSLYLFVCFVICRDSEWQSESHPRPLLQLVPLQTAAAAGPAAELQVYSPSHSSASELASSFEPAEQCPSPAQSIHAWDSCPHSPESSTGRDAVQVRLDVTAGRDLFMQTLEK